MSGGYTRILRVDLSRESIDYETLEDGVARKYVGGVGLAEKIVWDETGPGTEPFSPENPLIFMTGPLSGTSVPASSRYCVAGLSPLTGIWGRGSSGGNWADELRHAGFDGVVVKGAARRPVYLFLSDSRAEIRDASHLWGRDTYSVRDIIQKETDDKTSVACIGPSGERRVKLACVMNDGKLGRAAARCGMGALMGSKNLKAIAARGRSPIAVHDEPRMKDIVRQILLQHPPKKLPLHASVEEALAGSRRYSSVGAYPIKNWREGFFHAYTRRSETIGKARPKPCRRCPWGCGESHLLPNGERFMVGEHWVPMGINCLIEKAEPMEVTYRICQQYGLDSISTGMVIAFAMECFEKGLISKSDTGGIDLIWGNADAVIEITQQIAERRGFGELLGEGVKAAADRIGGTAVEYAVHVKGLELPLHDPRASMTWAILYATGNMGATHMEAVGVTRVENYMDRKSLELPDLGYDRQFPRDTFEGKGELAARAQDVGSMLDSLMVCNFLFQMYLVKRGQIIDLLNAATGWDMDLEEFTRTGERIFNLGRMINIRRGISRKDDTLPPRILTHPKGGGAGNQLPFLGFMLSDFYKYRGWSEEGIPTAKKLSQLGLTQCLDALPNLGLLSPEV